jgi:hypothetical protein
MKEQEGPMVKNRRKRTKKMAWIGRYPERHGEHDRQRTEGVRATPQVGEPGPDAPTLRAGLYRDGGAIPRGAPVPLSSRGCVTIQER